MASLTQIAKLAAGLGLAILMALISGLIIEGLIFLIIPSSQQIAGRGIYVVVVVASMPLYFYLVERYFIKQEKGGKRGGKP